MAFLLLSVPLINARAPQVAGNRMHSAPFISGDGFRSMANHLFDETDQSLQSDEVALGDIVFVKSDKLGHFFTHIHPGIKHRYILVSHNSDAGAPESLEHYLQDEKIIRWFGQNPSVMHQEKFTPIPIGVANRYVYNHGNCANFSPFYEREHNQKSCLLGYNFNAGTHQAERVPLLNHFKSQDYVQNLGAHKHTQYLSNMHRAKFILSPRGNGLDCHRTWEALIVGTIPVLKSSMLDELLDGLPVLIVDDWMDINQASLELSYELIKQKFTQEHLKKVTYAYWQEVLRDCQLQARTS